MRGWGGFLGVVFLIWFVMEFWLVILLVLGVGFVGMVAYGLIENAREQARVRALCPVCSGWSGSLLLTDLDSTNVASLCPEHAARHRRIWSLEQEVRPWETRN